MAKKQLSQKEKKELLSKTYLTIDDMYLLLDDIGKNEVSVSIRPMLEKEMENRGLIVPFKKENETEESAKKRKKLINTKVFVDKMGI